MRARIASALAFLFLACLVSWTGRAEAHAMRSAYLEILETAPGRALVTLRAEVPVTGLVVETDSPCVLGDAPDDAAQSRSLTCPGSVGGARLRLEGLGPILGEAVVFTTLVDGSSASSLLTPGHPSCRLPRGGAARLAVAREYVGLGLGHILSGFDHLLFLLGLVVVQRRVRAVLAAETAFTFSHSISYSATALGWVHVSPSPVEACIALSLVLVALEACRRASGRSLAQTSALTGSVLAFVFGLVHGLGFAGGLAEIGLPDRATASALAGFAVGVELGQIAFLSVVLALFELARRAARARVDAARFERWLALVSAYAVGSVGCFWLIERLRALVLFRT